MKLLKRSWHYILLEPFSWWLFYCFFQPTKFRKEYETEGFLRRIGIMLRLALPIFLISYPLALIVRLISHSLFPDSIFFGPGANLFGFLLSAAWATILSLALGIVGGVLGSIGLGIMGGIALGIVGGAGLGIIQSNSLAIGGGIAVAITAGLLAGIVEGRTWGMAGGALGGIAGGMAWGLAGSIVGSIAGGIISSIVGSIAVAIAFFVSYLLGYYRLPFYFVSGLSGLRTYLASQKNPLQVFAYLHRSSLYWDEYVFLPLPGLKSLLIMAVEQNSEQAQEEIAFIVSNRPQQIRAAQEASLEIAIRGLEICESLHDIAQVSQRLTEVLPQEARLLDPRWTTPFVRLNDASRNAARYYSSLSWKTRRESLEDIMADLNKVYPDTAFRDIKLNKRLGEVVNRWRRAVRQEQEKLDQVPDKIGQIDNPYKPGQVLELRDSLFVGRRDLVQQLEEALTKGSRRPTFFLNGERRMGKSSTLKQLPNLLGARYLPIIYDLQSRGVSSSPTAFLNTIAEEMYKLMSSRGMRMRRLETERLQRALRENEAAIYRIFDEWLDGVEQTLEKEDRTLLLVFDEFEKLEEAEQDGYIKLPLLLDWFRNVIQNRSRLALLFSGVRTISEMGTKWASYFVNVQTLRVSFLQPSEARQLITRPVYNFPSEQVFGVGVVEEIMRVTGNHPFLVQAICAKLIDNLNIENRHPAQIEDIALAESQFLENWWDTFFHDLWERTDQRQRICLETIKNLDKADQQKIVQYSSLDSWTARHTLQTLLKRDLILMEQDNYRIAAPIFSKWIESSL
jgi:AAA ATPase domain